MAHREMKIVFFGTSEFGAIILEKLVRTGLSPVLVVTTPDRPVGRKQVLTPPPTKVAVQKLGIPVIQPATLTISNFEFLISKQSQNSNNQNIKPDLFIVAAYGKILPKEILNIPTHGTLNVHPSLLPKYRGPSPVQNAILGGDKETGVTIMLLDEKMDHGPIVANVKFQMTNDKITYPELHNQLAELGAQALIETIPLWVGGKIKPTPQDDSQATYTSILKKEDGRIDWNKEAGYIERQVRALHPWPGTFALFEGKNLKILKASVLSGTLPKPGLGPCPKPGLGRITPGTVFLTTDKKLAIQCGEDALVVEELQLEGKKPMLAREFLLGHKDFLGIVLSQA